MAWGAPASRHRATSRLTRALAGRRVAAVVVALAARAARPGDRPARPRPRRAAAAPAAATGFQLTTVNPFIRLRRDLSSRRTRRSSYADDRRRVDRLPAHHRARPVHAATSGGPRRATCPASNSADGAFPNPPGPRRRRRAAPTDDVEAPARPQLRHHLAAAALPDPRARASTGNWRYDSRTLDVAYVGRRPAAGAELRRRRRSPRHHRRSCSTPRRAPADVAAGPMTDVPDDLPEVIRDPAEEVTTGRRRPTTRRRWRCRTGSAATAASPTPWTSAAARGWTCSRTSSPTTGSATASSSRPRWRRWAAPWASPPGSSSASWTATHAARRPDPLHQRRPARLAGDVLLRRRLGALRADARPARRRHPGVDPAGRRRPRPDDGAERRGHAERRRREPDQRAGRQPDVRRRPASRSRGGRWSACGRAGAGSASVPGARTPRPAPAPARRRRPGAPRRGRLGRAARHRAGPRAGLARPDAPRASRPAAWSDQVPRRARRRSRRWKGCWCRSSGAATAGRPAPARSTPVDPEAALAHVETVESLAQGDAGQRASRRARLAGPAVAGVAGARLADRGRPTSAEPRAGRAGRQ